MQVQLLARLARCTDGYMLQLLKLIATTAYKTCANGCFYPIHYRSGFYLLVLHLGAGQAHALRW